VDSLNLLPGITCNAAEGALYAFPRIHLPPAAVEAARQLGKEPDWLYCSELLEATGIVVVPGSGFGQAAGTYHFRTTFLPPESDIGAVVEKLSAFHCGQMERYGGAGAGVAGAKDPHAAAAPAGEEEGLQGDAR
jgi:aspartate/methionine/tyrosine aminotransferase